MSGNLDIKIFRKYSNKGFVENLEKAHDVIREKDAHEFFKNLLSNFSRGDLPFEYGTIIIKSLGKVLQVDENANVFLKNRLITSLPFNNAQYHESLFNIFYILFTKYAVQLDDSVVSVFKPMIKINPKKCLTLIALYSQQFGEIDNPWPIVDLLIQEAHVFRAAEIAPDYVSLLAYLNKKFSEYRSGRAQHCWNQITSMLSITDQTTLKCCYGALCSISEGYTEGPLQLDIISLHIREPDLQDCVLAFLNVANFGSKEISNEKLISTLLKLSEKTVKATLVLMKFAVSLQSAKVIMTDSTWILRKLPTVTDTLRLFLVVLRHKELRDEIVNNPDFVNFLNTIIKEKPGTVPIVCTILRRVPLSKELVQSLSKTGFLKCYYESEDIDDDGLTPHSKLLLTDTICRVAYVRDYIIMCERIAKNITKQEEFADAASLVAIRLCKYSRCRQRMKELKLDEYFKQNRNDPKLQSVARKFLRAISEID